MSLIIKTPQFKMRTLGALIAVCLSQTASADDLLSLYQRALFSSPELQGSQFAVDIAKAQQDQSFGKLLPQVVLTGNYSQNRYHTQGRTLTNGLKSPDTVSTYPGERATVSFRQPLFDLQAYLLMKSQKTKTEASEQELAAAHQKLIDDLVERYTDALEAIDKHEIIEAELKSNEKQLARVTAMQARQMAMITDMYELQARVETLRTSLLDSDNEARVALEKLRELTGDAVTHIQPARLDVNQPKPEGVIDTWVQQAGQINPELLSLKKTVEATRQSISGYKAAHLPRVELQLNGTYSNTTIYNLQSGGTFDVGSAAVEATMPIYSGGITSAQTREAEARKRYSEAQLEKKLRELENLTRAAYLDMNSSPVRTQASDRQLTASEKSRDAMQKGYELGVVTIVDLLESEKNLSDARKAQRMARYRYFKARAALLNQAGRLDVEELARMNQWLVAQKPALPPVAPTQPKPEIKASTDKPAPTKDSEAKAVPTADITSKEVKP
ncbi:MAG: TolC family outer membrane protein [Methylococcaceae bacterium]